MTLATYYAFLILSEIRPKSKFSLIYCCNHYLLTFLILNRLADKRVTITCEYFKWVYNYQSYISLVNYTTMYQRKEVLITIGPFLEGALIKMDAVKNAVLLIYLIVLLQSSLRSSFSLPHLAVVFFLLTINAFISLVFIPQRWSTPVHLYQALTGLPSPAL